jgi:autophagy-related protein 18
MTLNFVNFNQDFSCLSVGSSNGYRIYNCDPFGKCFTTNDGGIAIVEMLFCTSLVAVVGLGEPSRSPRRLRIVNTKRKTTICELTFPSAVLKVKLNRKRLVVLLEEQIYIYDIASMQLLHTIETSPNPMAICAMSSSSDNCYLVYPSPAPQFPAINLPSHSPRAGSAAASSNQTTSPNRTGEVTVFDALTLQPVNVIEAHKSSLCVVSLNNDGTLLATASDKGTIIRVFSIPSGQKLYQYRRGTYPSKVFSINFNLASSLLCVSSATQTVHVFRIGRGHDDSNEPVDSLVTASQTSHNSNGASENAQDQADEHSMPTPHSPDSAMAAHLQSKRNDYTNMIRRSSQSIGRAVGGYLPSAVADMWEAKQRDFAFFKLPCQQGVKSVVGFGSFSQHIFVVTSEGFFYQYLLNLENGGECELIKQFALLDDES